MDKYFLSQLVQEVQKIAVAAGREILSVYETEKFKIEMKKDDSPLTRADRRSHQTIIDGLSELDASFPILSEEGNTIPYEERRTFQYFWMVDPLDGTKEFIKRNGEFTVNIALIKENKPILGVVYVPVTDELFYAVKGQGALYVKDGKTVALVADTFDWNEEGLTIVCSRSHINGETQDFIDALKNPVTVARGSSLKFLILAKGEADIYPRLGPTMEWDTAAAHIILEEAGGSVREFRSGNPLTYNKENLLNPFFLAIARLK